MCDLTTLIASFFEKFESIDPHKCQTCRCITKGASSCLDCFKKQYFNGNDIDYECEEKRILYVLRFLPTHIQEIYLAFSEIPENKEDAFNRSDSFNFLAIGSGPGSDVVALQKAIKNKILEIKDSAEVRIWRLEKESAWKPIYLEVRKVDGGQQFHYHHKKGDALKVDFSEMKRFDIVTLSYFISEISEDEIEAFASTLRNALFDHSIVIINDRGCSDTQKKIGLFSTSAGLSLIKKKKFSEEWAGFVYPNKIKDIVEPKLKMNSRFYVFEVK